MKALEIFVSLLLFAPTLCNAQQDIRVDADKAIEAAAGSTGDPAEHQQKLAAVRLRLVQEATTARKEIERLNVDTATIKNRIDTAKFELNKLTITGVSNYDIAQFNSAIEANKSRLAELQALPDSDDKRNAQANTRQGIETLERVEVYLPKFLKTSRGSTKIKKIIFVMRLH
jgi:septal ring factor EnvC (AmiA/AmiB activator)